MELLAICLVIGPIVIISGVSITKSKVYRPQLYIGWIFLIAAMGAMSTLKADTSNAASVGIPSMAGIGAGFLFQATYYPVLSPLPVSENAHAMALFAFCRIFAGVSMSHVFDGCYVLIVPLGLGRNHRYCHPPDSAGKAPPCGICGAIPARRCHCLQHHSRDPFP